MEQLEHTIKKIVAQNKPCETSSMTVPELPARAQAIIKYFPNGEMMNKELNVDVLNKKYRSIRSCKEAYNLNKIRLNELAKCYGEDSALVFIKARFVLLNAQYNFSEERKFTMPQINELAEFVLIDFGSLNIAEFTYFFHLVKKGELGEMYKSLEIDFFLKAFKRYEEKRRLEFFHQQFRANSSPGLIKSKS